jgi:hypothetical protein
MVNLFTTYYYDADRENELYHVHLINKSCKFIDMIYAMNEMKPHNVSMPEKNVSMRWIDSRPTMQQLFDWVNEVTGYDDINIVANSDIYFDEEGIDIIKLLLTENDCWALTRWEMNSDNMVKFGNIMVKDATFMDRSDSQDTWCFRGRIKPGNYNFKIGTPGVDNRLAFEIQKAGYNISNPSWTVKTYHLHKGDHRAWHGTEPIPHPYLLVQPTSL